MCITSGLRERTRDWLKLKLEARQEFVVDGWTDPRRSRQYMGALLLGYWDGDRFVYAGHAGGGFTHHGLADMVKRLKPLERKASPFADEPDTNEPAQLQDRPLVLKRWPDGISGQSFFQQKAPDRTRPACYGPRRCEQRIGSNGC